MCKFWLYTPQPGKKNLLTITLWRCTVGNLLDVFVVCNDPCAPRHLPFCPMPSSEIYMFSQADVYHHAVYSVYLFSDEGDS